jgi:hypothetical protein
MAQTVVHYKHCKLCIVIMRTFFHLAGIRGSFSEIGWQRDIKCHSQNVTVIPIVD